MGISIFFSVISIFMLLFSILFLVVIKKWSAREMKRIDKKKQEIEEMLLSADQMIDELNKFSDYIIEHIGEKAKEAENLIAEIDRKIDNRKTLIQEQMASAKNIVKKPQVEIQEEKISAKTIIPFTNKMVSATVGKIQAYTGAGMIAAGPIDNMLNSNLKTKQIIALSENGYSEAEIARKLNIGRGEIQLILGMRNGTTS